MKRRIIRVSAVSLILAALAVTLFVVGQGMFAAHADDDDALHVIEHATTDTIVDLGPAGPSRGDLIVFNNALFNAKNQRQVGSDSGSCVLTNPGKLYECSWTNFLPGGQIVVQGPYYTSGADSLLAITGGTGKYKDAQGQMKLHQLNVPGTQYDFIFYFG